MSLVKITQLRSTIDCLAKQKKTMKALGLGKPNHTVIHLKNPQIMGMIRVVNHLVRVEDIVE